MARPEITGIEHGFQYFSGWTCRCTRPRVDTADNVLESQKPRLTPRLFLVVPQGIEPWTQ